jgi:hypothetical protein
MLYSEIIAVWPEVKPKYSDTSANEDNSLAEIFVIRNVISRRFL